MDDAQKTVATGELLELLAPIGADKKALNRWIRAGLPFAKEKGRRRFEVAAVRAWLVDAGVCEVRTVVATREEVARLEGVHPRTVATWLSLGCPGRPGHYDITAIRRWRDAHGHPSAKRSAAKIVGDGESYKARLERAKAEKEELTVRRLRRELVDVAEMKDVLAAILIGPLSRLREDLSGTPYADKGNTAIDEIISACHTLGSTESEIKSDIER